MDDLTKIWMPGDEIAVSRLNNQALKVVAQDTPGLTLAVKAGVAYINGTIVKYAGGNTGSITAPAANPRIDIITLDSSGTLARTAGSEAASPTAPAYPSDKLVLAEVYCRVSMTQIFNSDQGGSTGYILRDSRPIVLGTASIDSSSGSGDAGKTIKTDSNGKLDSTFYSLTEMPTPAFQQAISGPIQAAKHARAMGSSQDGSELFVVNNHSTELARYARDSITGMYFLTHNVNMTSVIPANDYGSIVKIGTKIYVFFNDGTNIICRSYNSADLTSEATPTIPTIACTSVVVAWTDGTDLYIISETSGTTCRKWTLSGTTFSASSTQTCSANLTGFGQACSAMYDGTTAYVIRLASSTPLTFNIYKLGNINGSSITSTTVVLMHDISDNDSGAFIINIDASRMYIGTNSYFYDEAAAISSRHNLFPITKP